jgi:hypothetical protein
MQGLPRAPHRALACAVVVLATSAAAGAEPASPAPAPAPPELALTWQAPPGCPTAVEVEARFVRLLGGEARLPSGKHIEASGLVRSSSSDHWSVELATVLEGAVGRRTFAGDSCASVSSAAALILALMIDPAAAERALLAPPAPTSAPPPAPAPADVIVRAAPPPAPRALRGLARVFGGGVVGLLPSAAPAAGFALGARRHRLLAELSFAAAGTQRVTATNDASGDFSLLVAGARACGALGGRVVVWHLCAGGELERLTGKGLSMPTKTETILMGAGTGGLLVTVPLGARAGLSLDAVGALRPYHPTFCAFCDAPMQSGTKIIEVPATSVLAALGFFITI